RQEIAAFVILALPISLPERIIGGQEVKPHSRPYMAYLKIENGSQRSYCGGFLISSGAVLSAAHCVDKEGTLNITVVLGAHNRRDQELSQQKFYPACWVTHPKYSRSGFRNDIVLLQLKPKARINKDVKVISFARSNEAVRAGTACMVAGWGWTSRSGQNTDVMREVELKVQDGLMCEQEFPKFQNRSMICAGDAQRRKATYHGDSGGPLICNQKAHGIVSHGHKCQIFPEVFTRISYFEPWIREQLKRFSLQELPGSPS
ncbi:CATG protein, partial [Notiomystis cincta]|nr:CATG protein [Notiomystis cincta]